MARLPTDPTAKKARARAQAKARRQAAEQLKTRKAAFLAAFAETHLVTEAAKRAGIHRDTAYEWRMIDPAFARDWADTEERSTEEMEIEARRRAVEGWRERGIYDDDGEEIGEVRKFSDTLLIFLLKARRPGTYRENVRHEHSGPEGKPIAAEIVTVGAKEVADAAHDFLARLAGPSA